MTKPTLTVVGGKAPEPDAVVEVLKRALTTAELGKVRGAFVLLDVDGDIPEVECVGDTLRLAALADLALPQIKSAVL